MDDATFCKLVDELAAMRYKGRVALHFFNEPLADENIVSRVRQLAGRLPGASIEIHSNGDYLTKGRMEELRAAGLSYIIVTAYSDQAHRRLQNLRQQLSLRDRAALDLRRAANLIGNRAGTLPQFAIPEPLIADCFQPSFKLVVNYKGEAVICTNDYFGRSVMGNVAEQSLMEIWQGQAFREARQTLRERRRDRLAACAGCNLASTPLRQRYLTADEVLARNNRVRAKPGEESRGGYPSSSRS